MTTNFGGYRGLVNFDVFKNTVDTICSTIEAEADVTAILGEEAMHAAYLEWIGVYFRMMERWQSRRQIPVMIAALIAAIHRADFVQFEVNDAKVVKRNAHVIARFPAEIMALSYGAYVYSQTIQRMTGEDPSCPLTTQQIETAAKKLRHDPGKARSFRSLLKLRPTSKPTKH